MVRIRTRLKQAERERITEAFRNGDRLKDIAARFNRGDAAIRRVIAESGAVRPSGWIAGNSRPVSAEERGQMAQSYMDGASITAVMRKFKRGKETVNEVLAEAGVAHSSGHGGLDGSQQGLPFTMDASQFAKVYRTTVVCGDDDCSHSVDAEHGFGTSPWDTLCVRIRGHFAEEHDAWGPDSDDLLAAVDVQREVVVP